jgi:Fe-S-cluster containining protein
MTDKIQSVCARCASGEKGSKNCCVEPFMDGSNGFGLTITDVARVAEHTGLEPEEFCSLNAVNKEEYEDDPSTYFQPLVFDGKWLGMNGSGKCRFLGERGCTIFEARPRICRIYPFWFDWDEAKKGRIKIVLEEHDDDKSLCALEHRGLPHGKMLESLNDSEENLADNIRVFMKEIELHRKWKDVMLKMGVKAALEESGLVHR